LSLFGTQMRFDLRAGFPLITTKRVAFKSMLTELLWFLRGDTNIEYLNKHGCHIWDQWADKEGDLGPVYGYQWRHANFNDQILDVEYQLKNNPYSRRHIVSAWNVNQIENMALPPCHCFFQFYVSIDGYLSCHLYMRSADLFLGVPFNVASYALLTEMFASVCRLKAKELVISFGDCHIYENHIDAVKEQLKRESFDPPTIALSRSVESVIDFVHDDVSLMNYNCHPSIKAEVAV